MHDVLIIIIITIVLIYLFSKRTSEHFSIDNKPQANEALQNLASIYNSNNIVVSELTTQSFNLLPRGIIMVWGNPDKVNPIKVPDGWILCDGNNNTPDLRNKFVLGGDLTFTNVDELTGGNASVTLTIDQLPAHTHNYDDIFFSESPNMFSGPDSKGATYTSVPGSIGSASSDQDNVGWGMNRTSKPTGEGKPISIMPPFYKLVYIMKT